MIRGFFYFPGLYFLLASLLLFEPIQGFVTYIMGITASATLSFFIGRLLHTKNILASLKKRIQDPEIKKKITTLGYKGVFLFHITGVSFDIPNYLSGYLQLNYAKFSITTLIANGVTTAGFYIVSYIIHKGGIV